MRITVVMSPGWEQKVKIEGTPALHRLVDEVERAVYRNVSQHVRSGALLNSIRSTKTINGGQVWIGTDHWHYIEYGTRPHVINPRLRQALWWPQARHPVARVRHPGTREYAPIRRAIESVRW